MYTASLLPLLAVATSALSSGPKPSSVTATYDDIAVVPAVPVLNPLGTYKGLTYTAFATNQDLDVTGVATKSPENNIVSGIQQTLLAGANAGWQIASGVKCFDLKSLYYGCSVNTAEGAAGVPQQCTFEVNGYRKIADDKPVAVAQFSFTPPVTLLAQPQLATFDKTFKGIERVEVVQLESTTGEALNVIVFDSVSYNLYA